jgi:hypothetical protein
MGRRLASTLIQLAELSADLGLVTQPEELVRKARLRCRPSIDHTSGVISAVCSATACVTLRGTIVAPSRAYLR